MPLWTPASSRTYERVTGDIPPPETGGVRVQTSPPSAAWLQTGGNHVQTAQPVPRLTSPLTRTTRGQEFYRVEVVTTNSETYKRDVLTVDIGASDTKEGQRVVLEVAEEKAPATPTDATGQDAPVTEDAGLFTTDDGGISQADYLKEQLLARQNAKPSATPQEIAPSSPQASPSNPVYVAPSNQRTYADPNANRAVQSNGQGYYSDYEEYLLQGGY